jgi:hypothetical protein
MRLIILMFLLLVSIPNMVSLSNYAFAQSVDTAWVRRYNGPGDSTDQAHALAVDESGNVYVTGGSSNALGIADYATIKYYPNGDTAWVRRYNGSVDSLDEATAVVVDRFGNVYVTGGSSDMLGIADYATIKYDPDGDTAWARRYNGPADFWDVASDLAVDSSCNVYVTGYSFGSGTADDYATIKYYSNGDTAWVRRYNVPGDFWDMASALAVDSSGDVYVTGYSSGTGTVDDYATIKYYPDGDTAWVRRYNGPGDSIDQAHALAVDESGNVYVTGGSSNALGIADYATIKYYPNGDTAWVRRYDRSENFYDEASAIAVDGSGNAYVTGGSEGGYVTIRYYANGDTAWTRRYNGPGNGDNKACAIGVDDCGNTYVTGYSWNGTDYDYATIKYDSSGNELWVERYNGPGLGDDKAWDIAVYGCDAIYVTGESYHSGTGFDYVTIKYVQNVDDAKDETGNREKPTGFLLSQNYPNPFNPTTKIEFTLAKPGFVSLNIYDLLGRKVRTLVSEHLSSGYKSVLWDGRNDSGKDVASGIYFYRLKTEAFDKTMKMVMMK